MSLLTPRAGKVAALSLVAAIGLAGCARVTPDQLQTQLTQVRSEMAAGDSALSQRIGSNDQRITGLAGRMDSLQRDLEALRTEFHASIQQMQSALRFNVPVHFAYDDATVREADQPVLNRFASVVQKYFGSDAVITVEGFADPAGSARYNLELGLNRAEAVKDYLVNQGGLAGAKINTVSYGEARNRQVSPGAHGPGDSGIENRRVALVIDYAGTTPSTTASR
jgi:peptidoglycan-associated lipoprotein